MLDSLGGAVDKKLPANVGDTGWSPGPGRFSTEWGNETHEPQLLKPAGREPVLYNRRVVHPATTRESRHTAKSEF